MSHTRIKIGIGEVLDERGKGEVMKWMKSLLPTLITLIKISLF